IEERLEVVALDVARFGEHRAKLASKRAAVARLLEQTRIVGREDRVVVGDRALEIAALAPRRRPQEERGGFGPSFERGGEIANRSFTVARHDELTSLEVGRGELGRQLDERAQIFDRLARAQLAPA